MNLPSNCHCAADVLFKRLSLDQLFRPDEQNEGAVGRAEHTVDPAEGDAVRGYFQPSASVHLGVVPSLEPVGSFFLQHIWFLLFRVIKKADRFLLSICLCIWYLLFGSSSLSTKGKRRFYICVLVQRKIAVWAAKKPDIIGLFAGDIFFVSTLWSECNYRISENADISMVCWQSARGIYSKKFKNDENNAAQQDNGRRFHI